MFITLDKMGERLALTAETDDKYKPRKTGLYDVIVDHWDGRDSENKMQMWFWDDKDHSLHNYGHHDTDAILFEGYNKNLVIYRNLGRDSQKFTYNPSTHFWRNDHTKRAMHAATFKAGTNALTEAIDDHETHEAIKWTLEYCSNAPTNVNGGGSGDATLVGL